jgi:hypothetical protein
MTEDEYYAGEFTDAELNCQADKSFLCKLGGVKAVGQSAAHDLFCQRSNPTFLYRPSRCSFA